MATQVRKRSAKWDESHFIFLKTGTQFLTVARELQAGKGT